MTEKLQQIKATLDFGYCPIVFACEKSSKDYAYLLNLWRIARDKTMIEYPEFTGHTWRIFNQNESLCFLQIIMPMQISSSGRNLKNSGKIASR